MYNARRLKGSLSMAEDFASASSFLSTAAIIRAGLHPDIHPSRGAAAVVAAHEPLKQPVKKTTQRPWTRWNNYKLSLIHTHKTCGKCRDLHQTDCLRCIERCGLLPLISRLSKKRNRLMKLFEHSDVLHNIAFCLRVTRSSMSLSPSMQHQDMLQRVAFGWIDPTIAITDLEDDSDEEWTKAAMAVAINTKT